MAETSFAFDPSASTPEAFLETFGGVYEHSPWVAEAVWAAGVDAADRHVAHLAARMAAIVEDASEERRLALVRAHPELVGRLAQAGALTAESSREQAGAGLDACSPDEYEEFQELNATYNARFGFPFIIAVTGLDRAAILLAFRARARNERGAEFETAIAEVHKIARIRLEKIAASASRRLGG